MYVRPLDEARHALQTVLTGVRSPSLLGDVYQEDFIAASWLWMLQQFDVETIAEGVAPFILEFKQAFGEEVTDRLAEFVAVKRGLAAGGAPLATLNVPLGGVEPEARAEPKTRGKKKG